MCFWAQFPALFAIFWPPKDQNSDVTLITASTEMLASWAVFCLAICASIINPLKSSFPLVIFIYNQCHRGLVSILIRTTVWGGMLTDCFMQYTFLEVCTLAFSISFFSQVFLFFFFFLSCLFPLQTFSLLKNVYILNYFARQSGLAIMVNSKAVVPSHILNVMSSIFLFFKIATLLPNVVLVYSPPKKEQKKTSPLRKKTV